MARFDPAYDKTLGHEAWAWTHRDTDAGAETFAGITRKWNPDWEAWSIIDAEKTKQGFPSQLSRPDLRARLEPLVRQRYRRNYWEPLLGDDIPSQIIAEELFDQAVNRSMRESVIDLQRSLNHHSGADRNWRAGSWPPVDVDGAMGRRQTIPAIGQAVRRGRELHVLATFKSLREADMVALSERRVTDRSNAGGWTNRIWGDFLRVARGGA